jgi:hypothetical protein
VLLQQRILDGIASGEITLAFRRWTKPTVRAGGRLRTRVGELAIETVEIVAERALDDRAARSAGFASRAELLASLRPEGTLYRVAFHLAGPDARIALRSDAKLTKADVAELARRLERLDAASPRGPWTRDVLRLIEAHPAVRAPDLAASRGLETKPFKASVRRLKELGLTESLAVGYRLSPRGRAALRKLGANLPPA